MTITKDLRWLLSQLDDEFTLYPVASVARTLFNAIDESESRLAGSLMGGYARKYWGPEEELYHDEAGLLTGAAFVLGQAAITQTLSILKELWKDPLGRAVIPEKKIDKLIKGSTTVECSNAKCKTSLSHIVIINGVSNYFKHVYEWPNEWEEDLSTSLTPSQKETISVVRTLGMKPGIMEITDNLSLAAQQIGLSQQNPRAIANCIQE